MPTAQLTQLAAPVAAAKVPAAQAVQVSNPAAGANIPTAQRTHAVAVLAEYWPATQLPQVAWPTPAKVPGAHVAHAAAPAAEYQPEAQLAQALDVGLPVVLTELPAPHGVHTVDPVAAAYWPAAQPPQLAALAPEMVPAPHLVQLSAVAAA
jgi:hypothetical protein